MTENESDAGSADAAAAAPHSLDSLLRGALLGADCGPSGSEPDPFGIRALLEEALRTPGPDGALPLDPARVPLLSPAQAFPPVGKERADLLRIEFAPDGDEAEDGAPPPDGHAARLAACADPETPAGTLRALCGLGYEDACADHPNAAPGLLAAILERRPSDGPRDEPAPWREAAMILAARNPNAMASSLLRATRHLPDAAPEDHPVKEALRERWGRMDPFEREIALQVSNVRNADAAARASDDGADGDPFDGSSATRSAAADEDWLVRRSLASDIGLGEADPETAAVLARDPHPSVRGRLLRNVFLPKGVVWAAYQDGAAARLLAAALMERAPSDPAERAGFEIQARRASAEAAFDEETWSGWTGSGGAWEEWAVRNGAADGPVPVGHHLLDGLFASDRNLRRDAAAGLRFLAHGGEDPTDPSDSDESFVGPMSAHEILEALAEREARVAAFSAGEDPYRRGLALLVCMDAAEEDRERLLSTRRTAFLGGSGGFIGGRGGEEGR